MAVLHDGFISAYCTHLLRIFGMFFQPINTITQQWNTLQSATVSVNRIWGIFAIQPEVADSPLRSIIDLTKVQGRIDFNRIQFSYQEGIPSFAT